MAGYIRSKLKSIKVVRRTYLKAEVVCQEILFWILAFCAYFPSLRRNRKEGRISPVFVVEEFYHEKLRGMGGYGRTVLNICSHLNSQRTTLVPKVFLSLERDFVSKPEIQKFHDTDVLLRPATNKGHIPTFLKYRKLASRFDPKVFISIEFYPSYEYQLFAEPAVPLLVWSKDPIDEDEWGKMATIPSMLEVTQMAGAEELQVRAREKRDSIKKIIRLSKILRRKILFAAPAEFLAQRAKKTYGLPDTEFHWLPNPIPLPELNEITYSERPFLFFLARLDPVKRPWIVFELARRFQNVDFLIAGKTNHPKVINPIIDRHASLKNLKFLGHVEGEKKRKLLRECWGLINTSIHEGQPISFLEAFSYGKCVVSSLNPDNAAERFGYYTGEILGEGLDSSTLDMFARKVQELLDDESLRREKGRLARAYVEEKNTVAVFDRQLQKILTDERIIPPE